MTGQADKNWDEKLFREWLFEHPDDDLIQSIIDIDDCAEEMVVVMTQIIGDWATIARNFPRAKQNKILWRMISYPLMFMFYIDDVEKEIAIGFIRASKELMKSIPIVTPKDEPMENGYYMWWDIVAEALQPQELRDECLSVLTDLLDHPDERVKVAVLHGLGHLDHDQRPKVVERFLYLNPSYDCEWSRQCQNGTVM